MWSWGFAGYGRLGTGDQKDVHVVRFFIYQVKSQRSHGPRQPAQILEQRTNEPFFSGHRAVQVGLAQLFLPFFFLRN